MEPRLTPPAFWILTALAGGRRHGYEILRETTQASGGDVTLRVATLYAALERLEREGAIRPDGEEIVNGRARRYFRLTDRGAERLTEEAAAMERAARAARASLGVQRFAFAGAVA